jgi:hypothetical protein
MPKKKDSIDLSADEREQLQHLIRRGTTATRNLPRARSLLKASAGFPDDELGAALKVGVATVERLRKRFVESGGEAIKERPR